MTTASITYRRLDNWALILTGGGFALPNDQRPVRLTGHLGERQIWTSRVKFTNGRIVGTRSGSLYELGEPWADYVVWLGRRGVVLDEGRPVRVGGAG